MTVLLHNISVSHLSSGGFFDQDLSCLLSEKEYRRVAKRMIRKYARVKAAKYMLRDDDALSYVAYQLMMGSCKWAKSDKRWTHRGYLSRYGKWAVQTWTTGQSVATDRAWDDTSVDLVTHDRHGHSSKFGDKIEDRGAVNPSSVTFDEAIEGAKLNDRQVRILHMVFVEGMKNTEVAEKEGVSRERIRQIVNKCIKRIRDSE